MAEEKGADRLVQTMAMLGKAAGLHQGVLTFLIADAEGRLGNDPVQGPALRHLRRMLEELGEEIKQLGEPAPG